MTRGQRKSSAAVALAFRFLANGANRLRSFAESFHIDLIVTTFINQVCLKKAPVLRDVD